MDEGGRRAVAPLASLLLGCGYWFVAARLSGVVEPWDAPDYWTIAYPGALLLAALLGATWPRRGWAWGAIVVLAQLPVVVAASGAGPLLAAGLLFALVLALPAMLVGSGAAWIRGRAGR